VESALFPLCSDVALISCNLFDLGTTFVPISAQNAFIYRAASRLSYQEFTKLDKGLVDKLGCEEFGKSKWRKLTQDEKYVAAYNAVSCQSSCEENLKATNFHVFLDAFHRIAGGDAAQLALIEHQIVVALNKISFEQSIAHELKKVYDLHQALDKGDRPTTVFEYPQYFWKAYSVGSQKQVEFYQTMMDYNSLQMAMSQLVEYNAFLHGIGQDNEDERRNIADAMIYLVRTQIGTFVKHGMKFENWTKKGSIIDQLFYDWNEEASCWQLDYPQCPQCTLDSVCQQKYHYLLHPDAKALVESDWAIYGEGTRESSDGEYSDRGVRFEDKTKPPKDCPQHWVRCSPNQWFNVFTKALQKSEHNPASGRTTWDTLTPHDLCTISESILLLSYSKTFCVHFGREKAWLEKIIQEYLALVSVFGKTTEDKSGRITALRKVLEKCLQGSVNRNGTFVPKCPRKYSFIAQIQKPACLSDPDHWGNLAWQMCEVIDAW
jgi:hypothetical protein